MIAKIIITKNNKQNVSINLGLRDKVYSFWH